MNSKEFSLQGLAPAKGAKKSSRRVGRGNASGAGRTAGRGEKGQKARTGGRVRPGFEGGQMPLYRRIPKFGFVSRKKLGGVNVYDIVDLDTLEKFEQGAQLSFEQLGKKGKVKVLGSGTLTKKLNIRVTAISKSAQQRIEELGGTVEIA